MKRTWVVAVASRASQDVLVNEGIVRQRTLYYMAFIVRGEDHLVLAFEVR